MPYLVQLVHSRADGPDQILRNTRSLEHAVQDLPVVHLDSVRLPAQALEHIVDNLEDLGVGNHGVVGTRDIEIALVEFPHAALCHGGLVTAVDLCDLVALEVLHAGVHGEVAGQRDCQVVAQRAQLTTLVLQVVDELRVLSIFAAENLLELEDGRVERRRAVALEDSSHLLEEAVAESSILAGPWLR
jgi:hypothetical protein